MHLTPATGGGGSQVRLFKAGAPLCFFLLSFMIILDYQDDLDKFCAPVIMNGKAAVTLMKQVPPIS